MERRPEASKQIVVLEPRRLAARLAAGHVADLCQQPVGESVGYTVRFENRCGPNTRIRYCTAGVLVRRIGDDPSLSNIGVLVFDEFHERHLDDDFVLAWARHLRQTTRPDLQIIVMSATLDPDPIAESLNAAIVRSEGRSYPIEIEHEARPDTSPLHVQVAGAVRTELAREGTQNVLVFLPGLAAIRRCESACKNALREHNARSMILHGSQSPEEARKALRPGPAGTRTVYLSTNIAESSVTLDGITTVIDSGLHKVALSSPWTGLTQLEETAIPKDSAVQRAGRAGRTGPGRCVRLFTAADLEQRPTALSPEVQRVDLASLGLLLRRLQIADQDIPWLDAPQSARWQAATQLLLDLGAMNAEGQLTDVGRAMAALPLHPRLARLVWAMHTDGHGRQGSQAAAVLDANIPGSETTDDILCDVWESMALHSASAAVRKSVKRSADQIRRALPTANNAASEDAEECLRRALLLSFPDRLARRLGPKRNEWALVGGVTASLSPRSGLRTAQYAVAVRASGGSRPRIEVASAVEPDWILELPNAEADLSETVDARWDKKAERVVAERTLRWRNLPLERTDVSPRGLPEAAEVLVRQVEMAGLGRFADADRLAEYRNRRRVAHTADDTIPALDDAAIRAQLLALCEGCVSLKEVSQQDLMATLENALTYAQKTQLNRLAPLRVNLASGSSAVVRYVDDGPPRIRARLQQFLGMADGPRLANGRVPVLLELLAPNQRPVQLTDDLRGFWERTWPQVRKELRGRYPKHKWPEDPVNGDS